jgi:hypothetical protein
VEDAETQLSPGEIASALDREDGLGRLVSLAFAFEIPAFPGTARRGCAKNGREAT